MKAIFKLKNIHNNNFKNSNICHHNPQISFFKYSINNENLSLDKNKLIKPLIKQNTHDKKFRQNPKIFYFSKSSFHTTNSSNQYSDQSSTLVKDSYLQNKNKFDDFNKSSFSQNKYGKNGIEKFDNNDIDAILSEVDNFFNSNSSTASNKKTHTLGDENFMLENFNKSNTQEFKNHNSNNIAGENVENFFGDQILKSNNNETATNSFISKQLDLNYENTNLSTLSNFYLNDSEIPFEEDFKINNYEDYIFGYKSDNLSMPLEKIKAFPFIKKLLFIYKYVFYAYIQKQEFRYLCQNIFDSEEFNLENMNEFQNTQPLEIKIAYYIAFKSLRSSQPIFLNKNLKQEIFDKIDSRNFSLRDILVYSKLNIIMQDINLMYKICDFLTPIFSKSITDKRYGELVENHPENINFFINLFIILLPCQKFLNLILNKYEAMYMNIFTSMYNLRKYTYFKRDINPLKGLLYILIKSSSNKKIKQSDIYKKFRILVDDLLIEYTDNYCSKILESSQFSNLVNYFTKYYSTIDKLDDLIIKKILDINFLNINIMEKYSESLMILLFKSIDNFVLFFENVIDKLEDKDELKNILENIIFSFFTIYKPNIAVSDSTNLDFSSIKNMDIIYLIKLKYMFTTYFPRTHPEASSYIIAILNLIDNSLNTISNYGIIYTIMGKCSKYGSIHDRKRIFEFYCKNIKIYLNDTNFFQFVQNFDILEKYGDIIKEIDDYRAFIIRQLIKMFYFDQIYYIFAKPDKLFFTIISFSNQTFMIEFDHTESKNLKRSKSESDATKAGKAKKLSEKSYSKFEQSYYPTFPKELYRFLNIIFHKLKTDAAIFNIYANRIQAILYLVKLTYVFEPHLLKENYFSVIYPALNFYGMNFLQEISLVNDINFINIITYYISLLDDNEKMMLYQMKLLAKYIVIYYKISDSPLKLFSVLKKIEEYYLLNQQPYDLIEKNAKNPKFMKLILRIKSKCYMRLKDLEMKK